VTGDGVASAGRDLAESEARDARRPIARARAAAAAADAPGEKAAWVAGVLALWLGVYYGAAAVTDPARAASLRTPLDDRIPFVPAAIWVYCCVYTAMLLPLFTVRSIALFRRIGLAYALLIAGSGLVFLAFPVTSLGFRPDVSHLDDGVFHLWGVRLNFFLDPPVNLFPSLHLSIATLAALSCGSVRRAYGVLAGLLTLAIACAVLLLKQHFWVDAVAGAAFGAALWAALVRPQAARAAGEAYGWGGAAAYVAFHAGALLLLAALWSAGLRPWA